MTDQRTTPAAERCDTTELLVDQCGCPQHRSGQTPQEEAAERRQPGPWFTAAHPGVCSATDVEFKAGDRIRADGAGGWECCDG